ncbi:MAG: endonuclease V [Acidimicrobiia bacterium]
MGETHWPTDPDSLRSLQTALAFLHPDPWSYSDPVAMGGCFVCFGRGGPGPGSVGERGWAAAVTMEGRRVLATAETVGESGSPYEPGLLATREGPLLASAVGALSVPPGVLLVNATGLDHPRRAGLALHLGWATDLPTVGVTHRPFLASGETPGGWAGSATPLIIDGEQVGLLLRTRAGALPLAVSPGWRTDLDTARRVVLDAVGRVRTPEPIRQARRLARTVRGRSS